MDLYQARDAHFRVTDSLLEKNEREEHWSEDYRM